MVESKSLKRHVVIKSKMFFFPFHLCLKIWFNKILQTKILKFKYHSNLVGLAQNNYEKKNQDFWEVIKVYFTSKN